MTKYPNLGVIWVDAHGSLLPPSCPCPLTRLHSPSLSFTLADLNTPLISPSGNLHGMPVGFLLGLVEGSIPGLEWLKPCLTPGIRLSPYELLCLPYWIVVHLDRLVYVGLRDVDFVEKKLLRRLGIKSFSMHEVDKFGIGTALVSVFIILLALLLCLFCLSQVK